MNKTLENILPIAKLGNLIIFVHKNDIPFIGKERAMEVKCIKVDLNKKEIDQPYSLELHLKYNPWEEITDEQERNSIVNILNINFSEQDILGRIIQPLEENKIKIKSA